MTDFTGQPAPPPGPRLSDGRRSGRLRPLLPPLRRVPGQAERYLGHTRSRQQRLAVRSRRLEGAAATTAVLIALVAAVLAPGTEDTGQGAWEGRGATADASPLPPGSADGSQGLGSLSGPRPESRGDTGQARERTRPTQLRIPQLDTDVDVFEAPLTADGGPPAPEATDAWRAAWYSGGVAPGEPGAALLVGHLDTAAGPAAFAGLGTLRPGAAIEIDREDGSTLTFTVDSVEQHTKAGFPDKRVYGPVDSPQLRLLTCAGSWSAEEGYDANTVVFAGLAS